MSGYHPHPVTTGAPGWVVLAGWAVILLAGGILAGCALTVAGRWAATRLRLIARPMHDDHGRQPPVAGWPDFMAGHAELQPPGEDKPWTC